MHTNIVWTAVITVISGGLPHTMPIGRLVGLSVGVVFFIWPRTYLEVCNEQRCPQLIQHPSPPHRRAPRRMRAGESLRLGRCALLGFTLVLSMSDRDGRFYGHISAGNHHHRKPAVNRTWRVDPLANPRNWTQSTGEWLYIWFCGEEEACVC